MDAIELTKTLVEIPSITGSERDILIFLEDLLQNLGFETNRQHVAEDRWNLYAGWGDMPTVVFCTHVDTVPPYVPLRFDEHHVYGRGSCDTKGIISSMIVAGKRILDEGGTPAFLFVVGEETDSIGAKVVAASERKASYIVVGEPTDNMLAHGHKGILSYTLVTEGTAAHSAYPELGHSAVDTMLDIIGRIRDHHWGHDQLLGDATLNIGTIQGGVAMNVLAPRASAQIIHRLVDDAEARKTELEALVRGDAVIQYHSVAQPQFLHVVPGFDLKTVHFGTDIPYLSSVGTCLLLGPGSIHDAHTDNEKISIDEIRHAVDHYYHLYHRLTNEHRA
jgi:acetylornithine deacetylase